MKCGILFSGNAKQIILTPEDDNEKAILDIIRNNQRLHLYIKSGQFGLGRDNLAHRYPAGYSSQYDSLFIIMDEPDAKSE